MNYRMLLQYDGTRYQGWQKQTSSDNTIQGKLETLLGRLTEEEGKPQEIKVNGAGRTDSGVHASGQTANFLMDTEMDPAELMKKINRYLPEDIAVISLDEASERFHARLNAKGKTYRYRIMNSFVPNVFERKYMYQLTDELDTGAMREAAALFAGKHDFRTFSSGHLGNKTTERTMESVIIENIGNEVDIVYTGDGFMYHMARIMTGTLIEIGYHKREIKSVSDLLGGGERAEAGFLAPAQGLVLEKVYY